MFLFLMKIPAIQRHFQSKKNWNAYIFKHSSIPTKNRSDVIRTRDLYVPNVALYQAEPHSDKVTGYLYLPIRRPCQGTTGKGFEPLLTESESAVLPLHHPAISLTNKIYYTKFFPKIKSFFEFFLFFYLNLFYLNPFYLM